MFSYVFVMFHDLEAKKLFLYHFDERVRDRKWPQTFASFRLDSVQRSPHSSLASEAKLLVEQATLTQLHEPNCSKIHEKYFDLKV